MAMRISNKQSDMKRILFIVAVVVISAVACKKEEVLSNPESGVVKSISGALDDGNLSKVSVNEDGVPSWTLYDQIVLVKTDGVTTSTETFTCDNPSLGVFSNPESTMTVSSGYSYSAFYPASQYNDGSYIWPSVVETPVSEGNYNVSYAPMYASASISGGRIEPLYFKNLAGLFLLDLKAYSDDCEMIIENINITADQALSGPYTISSGKAVVSGSDGVTVKYNKPFTVNSTEVRGIDIKKGKNKLLYIGAPINDYTNLRFTFNGWVKRGNDSWATYTRTYKATKTMGVSRSEYTNISFHKLGEPSVSSLELNQTEITMETGSVRSLAAFVDDSEPVSSVVTWTSGNVQVATVSRDGFVSGIGAGTTVITAKFGEKTATCTVTVYDPEPYKVSVVIDGDDFSLEDNRTDGSPFEFYLSEISNSTLSFRAKNDIGEVFQNAVWSITPAGVSSKVSRGKYSVTFGNVTVGDNYQLSCTCKEVTKVYYLTVIED